VKLEQRAAAEHNGGDNEQLLMQGPKHIDELSAAIGGKKTASMAWCINYARRASSKLERTRVSISLPRARSGARSLLGDSREIWERAEIRKMDQGDAPIAKTPRCRRSTETSARVNESRSRPRAADRDTTHPPHIIDLSYLFTRLLSLRSGVTVSIAARASASVSFPPTRLLSRLRD
jgi:hypothetical protein